MSTPLVQTLGFAAAKCAFYREQHVDPNKITTFPVLDKALLKARPEAFITLETGDDRAALLNEFERPMLLGEHSNATEIKIGRNIVIEQTSGSSGLPTRLAKTTGERTLLSLAAMRMRREIDPAFSPNTLLPLIHHRWNETRSTEAFRRTDVPAFYANVRQRGIRWMHLPPAVIEWHAGILVETGHTAPPAPALRYLEVSGAAPSEKAIEIATSYFKCALVNQYGTRETWAIGYAIGNAAFEVNTECVYVEILDAGGRPITRLDQEGDVVITSLVLRLFPIIRLRTGDRGRWVRGTSPSTRPLLKLAGEREINQLVFAGQRISGIQVFRGILSKVYSDIGFHQEISNIQVRQVEPQRIVLRVNRSPHTVRLCQAFERECQRKFGTSLAVDYDIQAADPAVFSTEKPMLFVNVCHTPSSTDWWSRVRRVAGSLSRRRQI